MCACLRMLITVSFLLQVCLISATLPNEILEMTSKFMTDPVRILVKRDELTLEVRAGCVFLTFVTSCPIRLVRNLVPPVGLTIVL